MGLQKCLILRSSDPQIKTFCSPHYRMIFFLHLSYFSILKLLCYFGTYGMYTYGMYTYGMYTYGMYTYV